MQTLLNMHEEPAWFRLVEARELEHGPECEG